MTSHHVQILPKEECSPPTWVRTASISTLQTEMVSPLLLYTFLSCSEDPQPCEDFCKASASLYDYCLTEGGASWENSQWQSEESYLQSCQTWEWEMLMLEEDALSRGELSEPFLSDYCTEQEKKFRSDSALCTDFTELDWSRPPWKN